jgi:hypothetical protein
MKIMGMGLNFSGDLLFKPMDEDVAVKALVAAMGPNAAELRSLTRTTAEAVSFRGEMDRTTLDPGDPRVAGWTFLVNKADTRYNDIVRILEPLALHRGMADPKKPLLYANESPDEWFDWLHDSYYALDVEGGKAPQYVLIVGGPEQVPFHFQSILDTVAKVGRVEFDTMDDLKTYVGKLIRIETAVEPIVTKEAILFATDAGLPDPTYFSRTYMAQPLADHIRNDLGFTTHELIGDDATKTKLEAILNAKKPALVYTASHGLGATDKPIDFQKRYNGGICCQHKGSLTLDSLFVADDVPASEPFLEGSVFFHFACFGYGTPAESDYTHWLEGVPEQYTEKDFVAALPKRLLAHPKGPIAFIGHLDTAFLHGFADPAEPFTLDRWHNRIAPFKKAVDQLLGVQPSGLAMEDMNKRYSWCNAIITNTYDRQLRGKLEWTPTMEARFLDNWITRGDAQNYMIFGDPAARLRIPNK